MLSITFNARFEFQNHYLYLGTLEDLFNLFNENNSKSSINGIINKRILKSAVVGPVPTYITFPQGPACQSCTLPMCITRAWEVNVLNSAIGLYKSLLVRNDLAQRNT